MYLCPCVSESLASPMSLCQPVVPGPVVLPTPREATSRHRRRPGPGLSSHLAPAGGAGAPRRSCAAALLRAEGGRGTARDGAGLGASLPQPQNTSSRPERETEAQKAGGRLTKISQIPDPISHRTTPFSRLGVGREGVSGKESGGTGPLRLARRQGYRLDLSVPSENFVSCREVCEPGGEVWRSRLGRLAPLEVTQYKGEAEGPF